MNSKSQFVLFWLFGFFFFCLPHLAADDEPKGESELKPASIESTVSKIRESMVTIRTRDRDGDELGMGTGFVVDPSGLIATNLHVISEQRSFTVELWPNKTLEVVGVEASHRGDDLAIIRVAAGPLALAALPLGDDQIVAQGAEVLAFGNPFGLRHSVVQGVVSAVREIEQREMIQLAMPIEPGNSGGPLVDRQGIVRGIINMKSLADKNIGFAVPVSKLRKLLAAPNPIKIDRWARMISVDPERWQTLFGANRRERSGVIDVQGAGSGFGGRSLCLSQQSALERPFEVAVQVKLDDESGAAGLVFHADGGDRHYGFYPSNGNLRLTCFKGPSVYEWEVIEELPNQNYLPGQWNHLKVRVDAERIRCYVNGHLAIESGHQQLLSGKIGLAKFRDTRAEFRQFRAGAKLDDDQLSAASQEWLAQLDEPGFQIGASFAKDLHALSGSAAAVQELNRQSLVLRRRADQLQLLADDLRIAPHLSRLSRLFDQVEEGDLLTGALLIAALHHPDLPIDDYVKRVDKMAAEVSDGMPGDASPQQRLEAMDRFLFEENGFRGGRDEYYHMANNHLDRVIDDHEGMPITLSLLYIELGRRLGLKLEGVGLPGHFVVRLPDDKGSTLIDVYARANRLSDEDVSRLTLLNARRIPSDEDFRSQQPREILTRILHNLIGSAERARDLESLRRYTEGLVALNAEDPQYRIMRMMARYQTKRFAAATEDLDWLLDRQPKGLDNEQIIQLKQRIMREKESHK